LFSRRDVALELVVPPVAAFGIARLVVWAASASAGYGFPGAAALTRHDSLLYLSIAQHGYTLFPCARVGGWCGTSGWMPLYPLLVAPFVKLGLPGKWTATAISAVFQVLTLSLLWGWAFRRPRDVKALLALFAAAVFLGSVYYAAVFPLSLLTFLVLVAFWFAQDDRKPLAAAAVVLAAATYPVGVFAGPALGIAALVAGRLPLRERFGTCVVYLVCSATGVLAVAVAQRLEVGHWDAYFLVQRHYGHSGTNPVATLRFAKESTLTFLHHPHRLDLMPQLQLLLAAAFVLTVGLVWIATRSARDVAPAAFVALAWAIPFMLGGISLYRSDAALMPGLILTRRLPFAAQAVFLVLTGAVGFEMDRLFFQGILA
jgi:hypothetical protein